MSYHISVIVGTLLLSLEEGVEEEEEEEEDLHYSSSIIPPPPPPPPPSFWWFWCPQQAVSLSCYLEQNSVGVGFLTPTGIDVLFEEGELELPCSMLFITVFLVTLSAALLDVVHH